MTKRDTIDVLLKKMDEALVKRERDWQFIESQYESMENGHIRSSDYPEYKKRKDDVARRFDSEFHQYQQELDDWCRQVRRRQPHLMELSDEFLNRRGFIPRYIALGKLYIQYENFIADVPRMVEFPFEKSMYVTGDEQNDLIHKLFLRLMYALPAGKLEFYVFDPMGLGNAVSVFNSLFSNGVVFPTKRVMTDKDELKKELKKTLEYAQNLIQNEFDNTCPDWAEYNRLMYSRRDFEKIKPYKVFTFIDVPTDMDDESFKMFQKILYQSRRCGFLVVFSYNEVTLEAEESRYSSVAMNLKKCIEESQPMHEVVNRSSDSWQPAKLSVKHRGERLPDGDKIQELLGIYSQYLRSAAESRQKTFNSLRVDEELYSRTSEDGLLIPIGFAEASDRLIEVAIGNETPHYLIGGTTGSGKSNFLNNLILSACCRYSPKELEVYLLDFKEGVEFTQFADPNLPHAGLIATVSDTEYGISVLNYLREEVRRRYSLYKKAGSKDIEAFRGSHPQELMPRILAIIDEFQVLFENSEKDQTIETLVTLAKQGRACGIHLVLATQTLKGLDFGAIGGQFGGRIALKCSAEDSKLLLGGIGSNNEAAAALKIPFAIMNTTQGNVTGNIKFSVPEMKTEIIKTTIKEMYSNETNGGRCREIKIFEGQCMPVFPMEREFETHGGVSLNLGQVISFKADSLYIGLEALEENNILVCGSSLLMKKGILKAALKSALKCDMIDEVIYIGNRGSTETVMGVSKKIKCFASSKEFLSAYREDLNSSRRFVVMDNCNLVKEVNFPTGYVTSLTGEAKELSDFIENANINSSYVMALYDRANSIKSSKLPDKSFRHKIGVGLNAEEANNFLGNSPIVRIQNTTGRFTQKAER